MVRPTKLLCPSQSIGWDDLTLPDHPVAVNELFGTGVGMELAAPHLSARTLQVVPFGTALACVRGSREDSIESANVAFDSLTLFDCSLGLFFAFQKELPGTLRR